MIVHIIPEVPDFMGSYLKFVLKSAALPENPPPGPAAQALASQTYSGMTEVPASDHFAIYRSTVRAVKCENSETSAR